MPNSHSLIIYNQLTILESSLGIDIHVMFSFYIPCIFNELLMTISIKSIVENWNNIGYIFPIGFAYSTTRIINYILIIYVFIILKSTSKGTLPCGQFNK